MKATGIVRRIDDLGRIVIPKEIRRTLHIRESDPLEIFTDKEGQIILKKYSPIGEMTTFAKQYAESLAQVSGHAALRETLLATKGDRNFISICDEGNGDYQHEAITPILCEGDIIGSVVLLQNDNKNRMGEVEQKLLLSAAGFLGRQMEQ